MSATSLKVAARRKAQKQALAAEALMWRMFEAALKRITK